MVHRLTTRSNSPWPWPSLNLWKYYGTTSHTLQCSTCSSYLHCALQRPTCISPMHCTAHGAPPDLQMTCHLVDERNGTRMGRHLREGHSQGGPAQGRLPGRRACPRESVRRQGHCTSAYDCRACMACACMAIGLPLPATVPAFLRDTNACMAAPTCRPRPPWLPREAMISSSTLVVHSLQLFGHSHRPA